MADRIFERVLNQTAADVEAKQQQQDPELRRKKAQASAEDELRKMTSGMTAGDAIKRILLAAKDKDYFRLLELPPPGVDALGRPDWPVTGGEVSKAYRKLSILVHPDKNPGEEARLAFEALNEAHRALKDKDKLEGILKEHLEAAQKRQEDALAAASLEERVVLQAQQKAQAKALRKAQGEALQAEVLRQMRERQEAAKRKREALEQSKYRRQAEDEAEQQDGEEEDAERRRQEEERRQQQQRAQEDSDDEVDAVARRRALAKRRQQLRKKASGI
ncbi:hypothetical protein ABPG77_005486 [Micractinium sp. CCAP 211/92]